MKKLVFAASAALVACAVNAAGFGIYEASARGNAVGGALVGATDEADATSVYYNPASIAFKDRSQIAFGSSFINPFCDVDVDRKSQDRMNSGWFVIPTAFFTTPIGKGFSFGWGNYTEYGLGTHYSPGWGLAEDTQKTTMRQVTLNPNLAYRVTDWWSVSAGPRISWIQFMSNSQPYNGVGVADMRSHLKGDDWGLGYSAATSFKVTEDVSVGLIYRSQIRQKIKGHFNLEGRDPYGSMHYLHGAEGALLKLPRSVVLGINWRVTEKWRVGTALTWTEWSSIKTIHFRGAHNKDLPLKWQNTGRFGFGTEYDLLDWLTVRGGYVYDMDPSSKHHGTTMLPAGDRHIINSGLGFRLAEDLWLDLGYSFIRMNNDDRYVDGVSPMGTPVKKRFATHNGFSHIASATLRYTF